MLYATCGTGASTIAKVATLAAGTLTLKAGATVAVRFTYANTASSPTLNVAGTGAKAIYTQGVRYAYWAAGATVVFTYDGANWRVASEPVYASTATIGNPVGRNIYIDSTRVYVRNGSTGLLEIGANSVDGSNAAYLKSSAIRLGVKGPSESGSSSTPHIRVTDNGAFTHEGEIATKNQCLFAKIIGGTKVVTPTGGSSVSVFTDAQINSLLGVTGSSAGNTAVFVSNGDGAANSSHVDGCTHVNGEWRATLDRGSSSAIRINYLIMRFA